jgi:DNA-binding response OmpR family regulator
VPAATILLVEDDQSLALMVRDRLGARGYQVWHAQNAAEAQIMADEVGPDLIIVDLMLPDMHGLLLCASLSEHRSVPIIICSGTKRKDDAAIGLRLGAADFIAKPFSSDELEERVRRVLQGGSNGHTSPAPARDLAVGPLAVDYARKRVLLDGKQLAVTPTEYQILWHLMGRANEVIAKDEVATAVWGYADAAVCHAREVARRVTRGTGHSCRARVRLRAQMGADASGSATLNAAPSSSIDSSHMRPP